MTPNNAHQARSFWRSPTGIVLIGFLAIAAFFLIAEHRAHIFTGSWGLALLLGACIAMHFFHGAHGRHGPHDETKPPRDIGE